MRSLLYLAAVSMVVALVGLTPTAAFAQEEFEEAKQEIREKVEAKVEGPVE